MDKETIKKKWISGINPDYQWEFSDDLDELEQHIKEKYAKEINLLDEYIKLLESEVSRIGGLSIVKPYLRTTPTTVAKGEKLRIKIKTMRDRK